MRRLLILAMLGLLALMVGVPDALGDSALVFTTVRLPDIDGSGTEPRMIVGPDDTRWAITNLSRSVGQPAIVYRSIDGGQTWQPTPDKPIQHQEPTIDVDVVAMHTGRILASELDEEGLNFPSSITDDRGAHWTETRGATEIADQDRQWFAVGPDDPGTKQPRVYLLYHNLGSGFANHNMFVSTSTNGGGTFGPPVPTAQPGSDAYVDLQCADSGGPSSIAVNPRTGRIYVTFTTRAGQLAPGGPDFGGCSAMPLEFNIVNATRVWVCSSADGSAGSWQCSKAVDKSGSGQIVSMQLAYGALDNQGGMYVAYPESPKQYPELGGAAVKLTYQKPDAQGALADGKWSAPLTLVPASEPRNGGANLVHLAVGDPGKIAVAYYKGIQVPGQPKPIWYTHVVHSLDALSPNAHVVDQEVSPIPTHRWTASEMMGICADPSPVQGVENGVNCDRSTDVWGIAMDSQCRLSIVWPTAGKTQDGTVEKDGNIPAVPGHAPGTYVSTQTGGPKFCGEGSLPGAAGAFTPGGSALSCRDTIRPVSRITAFRATRRAVRLRGVASDRGCNRRNGRVRAVFVSVARREHGRCRFLLGNNRLGKIRRCNQRIFLPAKGTTKWTFLRRPRLPKGHYLARARAVDIRSNRERLVGIRGLRRFSFS